MSVGSAEEGDDGVATELGHGPFVALDGGDHALVDRVDQTSPVLRIHRFRQRRRPDDVSEQRRDSSPFAD